MENVHKHSVYINVSSSQILDLKYMDLYIHSSIRLHGVVSNYSSTGTTLPFTP
jgi:hypothetical protein